MFPQESRGIVRRHGFTGLGVARAENHSAQDRSRSSVRKPSVGLWYRSLKNAR